MASAKKYSDTLPDDLSPTFKFSIDNLGECSFNSPFTYSSSFGDNRVNFVKDCEKILYNVFVDDSDEENLNKDLKKISRPENRLEKAGPREKIFFNPAETNVAICTCGGLCPGLNDVIRSIVRNLEHGYKVKNIWGFRYGYKGFLLNAAKGPIKLDSEYVDEILTQGGTILGSARGGGEKTMEIVDTLQRYGINILFVIGGDGTQKGGMQISTEAARRGYKLSVVGIPKTIDNDISYVNKTFGFETAVGKAAESLKSAHIEAIGAYNGIGLVKLMGRDSGFIAAQTALASQEANFVLIPEIPFDLEGENGFLKALEKRLRTKRHALVVVAEGAGQDLLEKEHGISDVVDAGGNKKLYDIGSFMKDKINAYFKEINMEATIRYIDPSYIIRASAPNSNDAIFCARLATNAVHAAMAGKTNMLISQWNGIYVHVPVALATSKRNKIHPESSLWRDVLESTLQPISMKNKPIEPSADLTNIPVD